MLIIIIHYDVESILFTISASSTMTDEGLRHLTTDHGHRHLVLGSDLAMMILWILIPLGAKLRKWIGIASPRQWCLDRSEPCSLKS